MTKPKLTSATGALNTLRHSLSDDEWRDALDAAQSQHSQPPATREQRATDQPRHAAIRRCLLRVDRGDSAPGIYIVRSRDISTNGIRILHGGPIKPETSCCVIIESNDGTSIAAAGEVAWCNPVTGTDPPAYELGIRFYEPIDANPFAQQDDDTQDVA
jgi:PilZ domain-containing protein